MIQFLPLYSTNQIHNTLICNDDSFAVCAVGISPMRSAPNDAAEIVSQILFGEPVRIIELNENWTKIQTEVDKYDGIVDPKQLFPLDEKDYLKWLDNFEYLPNMNININTPIGKQFISRGSFVGKGLNFKIGNYAFELSEKITNAKTNSLWNISQDYLNTPYLWGGKSSFGIDCSGLIQVIFRLHNIELPRDVSEQVKLGQEIAYDNKEEGDLAFFYNANNKITHVGIIGPKSTVIHASGYVRNDDFTPNGIWNLERHLLTHNLACIKRII